jgi:hypothetical protein
LYECENVSHKEQGENIDKYLEAKCEGEGECVNLKEME